MFSLNLPRLLTTSTEPRAKYSYVNGEKTEQIEGYTYRLIDISQAEILSITLKKKIDLPSESFVEAVNAIGRPYIANNRAAMSIRADDLVPLK